MLRTEYHRNERIVEGPPRSKFIFRSCGLFHPQNSGTTHSIHQDASNRRIKADLDLLTREFINNSTAAEHNNVSARAHFRRILKKMAASPSTTDPTDPWTAEMQGLVATDAHQLVAGPDEANRRIIHIIDIENYQGENGDGRPRLSVPATIAIMGKDAYAEARKAARSRGGAARSAKK